MHKKYGLLDDGTIEPLWYDDEEMRWILEDDSHSYLMHDKWITLKNGHQTCTLIRSEIIKEADTMEELKCQNTN